MSSSSQSMESTMLNDVRPMSPAVSVSEAQQMETTKSVWLESLFHLDSLEQWRDSAARTQAEIARLKGLCGVLATVLAVKGQHEPVNPEEFAQTARTLEDRLEYVEGQLSETVEVFVGLIGDVRAILRTDKGIIIDRGNQI